MNRTNVISSLACCPMEDAPQDKPIILVSPWAQTAIAIWDEGDCGSWRYGPNPGDTWDAKYPVAWVPVHACEWIARRPAA
jgi:hypothetical protein